MIHIHRFNLGIVSILILGLPALTDSTGATPPDASPDSLEPPVLESQPANVEPRTDSDLPLLDPLPPTGTVPPIVDYEWNLNVADAYRANHREYERQLTTIRHKYFGNRRAEELRSLGYEQLREFTDPAAFPALIEVFKHEKDEVRLAILDHFARCGEDGQAALAWLAIYDHDHAIRHEATKRLGASATQPVLHHLDVALRSSDHTVATHAATLAGTLNAVEAIPLLMFAQATGGLSPTTTGDLAWIAIEKQIAYVQDLVPQVGGAAGAFMPVIGTISEGTLMRVVDAVVIVYRTEVHHVLVAMTTSDFGESTAHLNYDLESWWYWYNDEYVPFKNEQILLAHLAGEEEIVNASPEKP